MIHIYYANFLTILLHMYFSSSPFYFMYYLAGHVDAGKSTVMGHLLFLLGNISKRVMHK